MLSCSKVVQRASKTNERIMENNNNEKYIIDTKTFREIREDIKDTSEEDRHMIEKLKKAREDENLKNIKAAELEYNAISKVKDSIVAVLDEEAKKKAIPILRKAYELKQEQEEEIKHCTSLILSAKCLAINCAQIEENKIRRKCEKEKAFESEQLLKQENLAKIKKFNDAKEAEQLRKDIYAIEIRKQIKANEYQRKELEFAKLTDDVNYRIMDTNDALRTQMNCNNIKMKNEQMRQNCLLMNTRLNEMKLYEKDVANKEYQKILKYNQEKQQQKAEYEEDMKKKKILRELGIKKIQDSQKASQNTQGLRDELVAIRTLDKVEREWRRKELENEMKKIKKINDLKESRRQQIKDNRNRAATDILEEKDQFNKLIRFNTEDREKMKEIEKQTHIKVEKHLQDLKQQMADKECERVEERRMFFQEGVTYQENKDARENAIRNTIIEKIAELKKHNVPKKSVQEIELKLKKNKWL